MLWGAHTRRLTSHLLLLLHDGRIFTGHRTIAHVLLVRRRHLARVWIGRLHRRRRWNPSTQNIESVHHCTGKRFRVHRAGKVQTVHELRIAPLVERGGGLIILEALDDRAVNDDLMILQFPANDAERVVLLMVEDLHLAQTGRAAGRNPLPLHIVVHHDRGPGTNNTLFIHFVLRFFFVLLKIHALCYLFAFHQNNVAIG